LSLKILQNIFFSNTQQHTGTISKEYKNKANQKPEKQIIKVKTKMRAFTFDNSSDEDSSSLEWDDRDEDPTTPDERQRSREIENRRRKIRKDFVFIM
jgi:hypothetical protein